MLRLFGTIFSLLFLMALALGAAGLYGFWHYGKELPDYRQLADYEPAVMTRVHAGDGSLMAEYAKQRRLFVPIEAIPTRVIQSFLSAEDKTFYQHPGIDFLGIASAAVKNLKNLGSNRRPVGASTITQQVAKNFLLSNEVSITRKIKEAILAYRMEQAFTKDRILELYINEIYLGFGSYGVAAAALNYFNKSMDELTLAEAAYLAALPKAPNNYHPYRKRQAAIARRNWVLERMVEDGFVTRAVALDAKAQELGVRKSGPTRIFAAEHFAEEVRRELMARYGEDRLYGGGLSVRTSLEPELQAIAEKVLRKGLIAYDRRHGWRGPLRKIPPGSDWQRALSEAEISGKPADWQLAAVLSLTKEKARIGFADGKSGEIPLAQLKWARKQLEDRKRGRAIKTAAQVLAPGDMILVSPATDKEGKKTSFWGLRQIPEINGAIVAMDPHTGRILAMVGGFSYDSSQFNRATQAMRQPGSAFKPFVYAAALDNGFTPSSLVLDAPFVIDLGPVQGRWKPANYTKKFYGPSTLRLGVEKSRNLMTVRLANHIGMDKVVDYAGRFGVIDNMDPYLPMALGAGETTLLKLTTGYAMLVNGGKKIIPTLIDKIQDRRGKTIFRHDTRDCPGCETIGWQRQEVPEVPDNRPQSIDTQTAYQVVSMLEGVVRRGTGRRIAAVGKPLGGKTGTTNESRDTWFIGFAPDLAVGVFAGFDQPSTLGRKETGSSVAAPVFRDFMAEALANRPGIPFRVPPGIQLVRVDAATGAPALRGTKRVILEAFKAGTVPEQGGQVLDGSTVTAGIGAKSGTAGTGGLY
jgi:penicillin-binding protein 1A